MYLIRIKLSDMKSFYHPNFILGLFSLFLFFIGIGLQANGYESGSYVLMSALGLGGVHWIWSIIDVLKDYHTDEITEDRNILWVILGVIPVGGLLYYALGRKVTI